MYLLQLYQAFTLSADLLIPHILRYILTDFMLQCVYCMMKLFCVSHNLFSSEFCRSYDLHYETSQCKVAITQYTDIWDSMLDLKIVVLVHNPRTCTPRTLTPRTYTPRTLTPGTLTPGTLTP